MLRGWHTSMSARVISAFGGVVTKHSSVGQGRPQWRAHARLAFRLASFAMLSLVLGCATTRTFKPAESPGRGSALVYFIRDHFPPLQREAQLYVNGNQVATMADDDFVAVNLPLGENTILLTINGDKPITFTLPVTREETSYVALSGDVTWALGGPAPNPGWITIDLTRHLYAKVLSKAEADATAAKIHRKLG